MLFNWFTKEKNVVDTSKELLKEAQKTEEKADPTLPKKTLPKSYAVK